MPPVTCRILLAAVCVLAFASKSDASEAGLKQDFRVCQNGDGFVVLGVADGAQLFESTEADTVIQFAIDALGAEGGQVSLSRGEYPLNAPIVMKTRVYLEGSGRATRLLVVESNATGIGIEADEVSDYMISNLSVIAGANKAAKVGILIDACRGAKIEDLFVAGFADYGIWMRNHAYLNEISGCYLAGNRKVNLFLQKINLGGEAGELMPNLVSNCTIYGGGEGIRLSQASVVNVVACSVYQTNGPAFHLEKWSNSVLLSGCRSFQITGPAVVVDGSMEFNATGNIFCWHTEQGILLTNARWGTLTGNNIIDSGSYNTGEKFAKSFDRDAPEDLVRYDGIEMRGVHGYQVVANNIFNWDAAPKMRNGVSEDAKSRKNLIANNNINFYAEADVLAKGDGTEVHGNVLLKDEAHVIMKDPTMLQSFRTELTEDFIQSQTN
jgi:hypothetical protein